jgi:hypothetical protein
LPAGSLRVSTSRVGLFEGASVEGAVVASCAADEVASGSFGVGVGAHPSKPINKYRELFIESPFVSR